VREKRINGERIDELKERVEVMLVKKFGRHVSVVKLESLIVNPHVVELRQGQQDFALACGQELKDWNVRASSRDVVLRRRCGGLGHWWIQIPQLGRGATLPFLPLYTLPFHHPLFPSPPPPSPASP